METVTDLHLETGAERPVVATIAVPDAAEALGVPVELVEAYLEWRLLDGVDAPAGRRVTIASVGALAARRRSVGREGTAGRRTRPAVAGRSAALAPAARHCVDLTG